MKPTFILLPIALAFLGSGVSAAPIEQWLFEETAGTQFSGLANSAGTAAFTGDLANATTDGSGNLAVTIGGDIFRNATLTTKDVTTGKYELAFAIPTATIAGGDASGANCGFGLRDETGTDLFLIRLQRQSSVIRLEYRTGTTTLLENFSATASPVSAVTV